MADFWTPPKSSYMKSKSCSMQSLFGTECRYDRTKTFCFLQHIVLTHIYVAHKEQCTWDRRLGLSKGKISSPPVCENESRYLLTATRFCYTRCRYHFTQHLVMEAGVFFDFFFFRYRPLKMGAKWLRGIRQACSPHLGLLSLGHFALNLVVDSPVIHLQEPLSHCTPDSLESEKRINEWDACGQSSTGNIYSAILNV